MNVENRLCDQVVREVREQFLDFLNQVDGQLRLGGVGQVNDQVYNQIYNQVWRQAYIEVRANVKNMIYDQVNNHFRKILTF